MALIAFVCAVLLVVSLVLLTRTRRRPATLPTDVHSMRRTLERKVREGADFTF